jgi:hypothetical protein
MMKLSKDYNNYSDYTSCGYPKLVLSWGYPKLGPIKIGRFFSFFRGYPPAIQQLYCVQGIL